MGTTLNARAVAEAALEVARAGGHDIALVAAGEYGQYAEEDVCGARTIARHLAALGATVPAELPALASRGIARPTEEEAYALTIVEAKRSLVEAVRAANYKTPDIDELTSLAAVEVTPAYIQDLAGRGYKPKDLDDLVQFAAVDGHIRSSCELPADKRP